MDSNKKIKLLKAFGVLHETAVEEHRNVLRRTYEIAWYHPLSWILFTASFALATVRALKEMSRYGVRKIREAAVRYRAYSVTENVLLKNWHPRCGEMYYCPFYWKNRYIVLQSRWEDTAMDRSRLGLGFVFAELSDCKTHIKQLNKILSK